MFSFMLFSCADFQEKVATVIVEDFCIVGEWRSAAVELGIEEIPPMNNRKVVWCDLEQGPYEVPFDGRHNSAIRLFELVDYVDEVELRSLPRSGPHVDWKPVSYECENGHDVFVGHEMTISCAGTGYEGSPNHFIEIEWSWSLPND